MAPPRDSHPQRVNRCHSDVPSTLMAALETKIKVPENSRIIALSLIGSEIWIFLENSMVRHALSEGCKYRWRSNESIISLELCLFLVPVGELLDAECYY
ncbi:hypothetical protein AVEN_23255-1 [Araneus ventricosus]|uniref:Uncharacterized protein n=1 Tax=Araneus ventricosus TaxID=182803 RepID=A0A4Y2K141_ARAVE|nr:hypothetical protein AVEN_23255-1 [Araneus ventricosus]